MMFKTRLPVLLLLFLVCAALLAAPACKAPAKFEVQSINLTPLEVPAGNTVYIITKIKNTGSRAGVYNAELKVNGHTADTQQADIEAGGNQTLTFALVETEPGKYRVSVEGLEVVLTVVSPPPSMGRN
jgi:hypothetical protein